jgi:hypothetical protein
MERAVNGSGYTANSYGLCRAASSNLNLRPLAQVQLPYFRAVNR